MEGAEDNGAGGGNVVWNDWAGTVSYLALLKKNDAQYQLTGENVTEEEFVETVKMFL